MNKEGEGWSFWQQFMEQCLQKVHLLIFLSPGKQIREAFSMKKICLHFAEFTWICSVWGCEGSLHLQLGDIYPTSKIPEAELTPVPASANAAPFETEILKI